MKHLYENFSIQVFYCSTSRYCTVTTALDDQVKPLVASFKGKVSLFAKNLDTGETYALNPDERVRTASTIKIAVMIEAFARVPKGRRSGLTKWS
jgi:beta-lactamase class A